MTTNHPSSSLSPSAVAAALDHLAADLPGLVGTDWPTLEPQMAQLRAQLTPQTARLTRLRAAVQVAQLLADYPPARQRLQMELLLAADLRAAVHPALLAWAQGQGMAPEAVDQCLAQALAAVQVALAPPDSERGVTRAFVTQPQGLGGGRVVRLDYIQLDGRELLELLSGIALAGSDVAGAEQLRWLVLAAALVQIVRSLQKIATAEVDENLATVYWGLVYACRQMDRCASLEAIHQEVNAARHSHDLTALSTGDVRQGLAALERMRLARACPDGGWRYTERIQLTEPTYED